MPRRILLKPAFFASAQLRKLSPPEGGSTAGGGTGSASRVAVVGGAGMGCVVVVGAGVIRWTTEVWVEKVGFAVDGRSAVDEAVVGVVEVVEGVVVTVLVGVDVVVVPAEGATFDPPVRLPMIASTMITPTAPASQNGHFLRLVDASPSGGCPAGGTAFHCGPGSRDMEDSPC